MANESFTHERITQLDYMKALAVLLVVFTHGNFTAADRQHPFFVLIVNMAMPIFMLIYGYVRMCATPKPMKTALSAFGKTLYGVLVPSVIIFLLETVCVWWFGGAVLPPHYFETVIRDGGGLGPGSYYIAVLLQLTLIYPLMAWCFRRHTALTAIGVWTVTLVFELLTRQFVSAEIYRIICVRYLPYVVGGMLIAKYRSSMSKWKWYVIGGIPISLVWVYSIVYRAWQPPLFYLWATTNPPMIFWATGLFLAGLHLPSCSGIGGRVLSAIGTSSYYIFLVQMVWYGVPLIPQALPLWGAVGLSLVICVGIGVAFRYVERAAFKRVFCIR